VNQPARILVVDDEERNRALLSEILLSLGYAVELAENGQEAVRIIRQAPPDVVLLDIHMPVMNGLEVTRIVKEDPRLRHTPIVIITGAADTRTRVEALRLGADDFLQKPPHLPELTARVRSLVKVKAFHDHLLGYQKKLEQEVAERTRELEQALGRLKAASLDTIYRLSRAAEYKDEDTAVHIQRISYYAQALARQMGLTEEQVEAILYAAPMHDIGKIGVPDRILLKPGKLDAEEWRIMKQHTVFGGRILEGGDGFMAVARSIALSHHERWDGTGYPLGLQGPDTPLEGRITAVVDVFDALTSRRPYKEALPVEESLEIIREGSGGHFDPHIVVAFFAAQPEILRIRERLHDSGPGLLFQLHEILRGSPAP
jgi:putative two-component system response regulator